MTRLLTNAGLQDNAGLYDQGGIYDFSALSFSGASSFNPLTLDPYLLFDAATSMRGTLEAFTLDLDPANPSTLEVITANRAGVATFTDANNNIATAPSDTVRVDYVDSVPMILVEPSATNLLSYSEDFTNNVWKFSNPGTDTVGNAAVAPNGTTTAESIVEDTTTSGHRIMGYFANTITSGTAYTFSVFLKANGRNQVGLFSSSLGNTSTVFDLAASTPSISTQQLSNGWRRCQITGTASATGAFSIAITLKSNSQDSYDGDGTSGLHIWGAQLEEGAVMSSYIPSTSNSSTTRAADNLEISGSAFSSFFNNLEGTTYVEIVPKIAGDNTTNLPHIFEYHNSSDANANRMGIYLPTLTLNAFVRSSGVTTASVTVGNVNLNQLNRVAVSYKVNDILASLNGTNEVSDTSAALSSGIDTLHIGNVYSFAFPFLGHVKRLIYWPTHSSRL
jgi:hypothetical protein|tara:strand:- start:1572 stop:2915 length:1344 start_codon:yes stop_codon:yes gene_type:complete